MFDEEGIWLLSEMEQFVIDTMLSSEEQEHIGHGEQAWTADYWTIEVAKCLRMGIEAYEQYPLSPWLVDNPCFQPYGKKHIIGCTKYKLGNLENLKKLGDRSDNLFVCQIGRGLPVIVAFQAKRWKCVLGYDKFDYGKLLNDFFEPKLSIEIVFEIKDTVDFSTEGLDIDVVMSGHNTRFTPNQLKEITSCWMIRGYTHDGHIVK